MYILKKKDNVFGGGNMSFEEIVPNWQKKNKIQIQYLFLNDVVQGF